MGHPGFWGWLRFWCGSQEFLKLVGRFPAAEGVFVEVHVDALASELYALDAEA